MKTIITTTLTLCMSFTMFCSLAAESANPLKNRKTTEILAYYVEAITLGNLDFNNQLFTNDFEYQNTSNSPQKINKKTYVNYLKQNKGLKYDCKTTYHILDETSDTCIAKAVMKFEHFTRIDYITLRRGTENWQVSKVVTTYP